MLHSLDQFFGFGPQLALWSFIHISLQVIRSLLILGLVIIIERANIEHCLPDSQKRVRILRSLLENLLVLRYCSFIASLIASSFKKQLSEIFLAFQFLSWIGFDGRILLISG